MIKKNTLINDENNFSPQYIRSQGNFFGIKKDSIEMHIWIYEIIGQIQRISGQRCILKGGASAQLYIPVDFQRCTVDIDMICSLSENEIVELLTSIQKNLIKSGISITFEKYIPKVQRDDFHTLPMVTYLLYIPFIYYYKGKKRGLKIDFLFGDTKKVIPVEVNCPKTIGLDLRYSLFCVSKNTLTAEKLLTFATNSVGLENYKVDGLYKNLYDLYYLINLENSLEAFKDISINLSKAIDFECKIKNISTLSTEKVLIDILNTLLDIFTWDLKVGEPTPHRKLKKFMETSLQRDIKQNLSLDTWAIIAMNIYVYAYSIKEYLESGSYESLQIVNEYIDDLSYIRNFTKSEKKTFKKYISKTIGTWDPGIMAQDYHSMDRLAFLINLIEYEII